MIEINALLAATADEPPCGPDLEHDPAFMELEQAAQGKPEQQFGKTVIPAKEPVWSDVRSVAIGLLGRSKDLRVATLLVRALVHTEGFPGLLPGLQLIQRLLDQYWDDLHPRLDAEEDNDPTMRLNALAPLVHAQVLLHDLRNAWLVRSRQHGQLLVRDIEIALGKMPPRRDVEPVSLQQLESVFSAVAAEDLAALTRIGETLVAARALSASLIDRVGAEQAPDFTPLLAVLSTLDQACAGVLVQAAANGRATGMVGGTTGDGAEETVTTAEKPVGREIRSRQDALVLIDRIITYLEHNEPTNPAQLLLKRAKRLMNMSFVDIIKDMVPDSVGKIEAITGPGGKE